MAFLIRMKPAEVAALRRLARNSGTTLGVYSRQVLRKHLKRAAR